MCGLHTRILLSVPFNPCTKCLYGAYSKDARSKECKYCDYGQVVNPTKTGCAWTANRHSTNLNDPQTFLFQSCNARNVRVGRIQNIRRISTTHRRANYALQVNQSTPAKRDAMLSLFCHFDPALNPPPIHQ